jgi:hypothetical protein
MCWKFGLQSVQGCSFWRWLDHEGCDFMSELIHLWIHNLMGYWETVETFGAGT